MSRRQEPATGNPAGKEVFHPPEIGTVEELSARLLQANQQLAEANEKLRLSEARRSEMLSNISHDLRAPATALRSAVDTLREDPNLPDGERRHLLDIMDRRTAVLEHLIAELHYLVALDLPSFTLRREPADLAALVEEYAVTQHANQKYAGRRLVCQADLTAPMMAEVDANAVVRIFDNLFENALRFTREGDTIAIGCRAAAGGEAAVELYVSDTGAGIPAGQLEAIFERTHTVSRARTPDTPGGSGLGLSIVKKLVELHGGRVWCESTLGAGSTFRLVFPAAAGGGI